MTQLANPYLAIETKFPVRGLNKLFPSTELDPRFLHEADDVVFDRGVAKKREGYRGLGSQLADPHAANITDPILALIDFEDLSGNNYLVCVTTTRIFYWNTGGPSWDDITAQSSTHNITAVSTGSDTLTCQPGSDLSAQLPVGTVVYVAGSTGNNGTYTVASGGATWSAPNLTIPVDEDITDATVDGTVQWDRETTGDEDNWVDWAIGIGEYNSTTTRYLVITNGVDLPRIWDGSGNFEVFTAASGLSNFVSAKTVEIFKDHLIFGNITTTTNQPQTVEWSDTLEFDDFGATGNSGSNLFANVRGDIQRLEILGDRVQVYAEDSISEIIYLGGDVIFGFSDKVQDTRLASGRSILNLGPYHLFASQENIYVYEGQRSLTPIGDLVNMEYREIFDQSNKEKSFAFHNKATNEIWWIVPTSETSSVSYHMDYDIRDIFSARWSKLDFTDRPQSMGFFVKDTTLKWNSSVIDGLAWNEMVGQWNVASVREGFPNQVMGSNGFVYINDGINALDDDSSFDALIETIDFSLPQINLTGIGRWANIEIESRGSQVIVEYSVDQGKSWTAAVTQSLTPAWEWYRVNVDVTGKTFRVRLKSSSGSYFEFRRIKVWVKASSLR